VRGSLDYVSKNSGVASIPNLPEHKHCDYIPYTGLGRFELW
jgi:hypothetical protein